MVKRRVHASPTALLALALAGAAWAQIGRLYDPSTVQTVSGEVVSVDKGGRGKGLGFGVELQLKTDKGTLEVHLAPAAYIERQGVTLEPKDKIEVKGSRVEVGDKVMLIAAQVTKGGKTLKLRDDKGVPLWRPAAPPVKQKT